MLFPGEGVWRCEHDSDAENSVTEDGAGSEIEDADRPRAKITVKLQQNFKNMKLKNGARSVRSAASTAADSSGGGLGGAGASSRGGYGGNWKTWNYCLPSNLEIEGWTTYDLRGSEV